jgi:hypothetical protein
MSSRGSAPVGGSDAASEASGHYVFHVQLIADFLTIEEMGLKMLAELKGLRGGN